MTTPASGLVMLKTKFEEPSQWRKWRSDFLDYIDLNGLEMFYQETDPLVLKIEPGATAEAKAAAEKTFTNALDATKKRNKVALFYLKVHLGVDIKTCIAGETSAHKAWRIIDDRYNGSTMGKLFRDVKAAINLRRDSFDSIDAYMLEFDSLFNRIALDQVKPEAFKIAVFVAQLGPAHEAVIQTMIGEDQAKMSLSSLANRLREFEDRLNDHKREEEKIAFLAHGYSAKKRSPICDNCSTAGHKYWECKKPLDDVLSKKMAEFRKRRHHQRKETAMIANGSSPDGIILDSGTTAHMTGDAAALSNLSKLTNPVPIAFGDNSQVEATHEGTMELVCKSSNGNPIKMALSGVLYVPSFRKLTLISEFVLCSASAVSVFNSGPRKLLIVSVKDQSKVFATATNRKGLYHLDGHIVPPTPAPEYANIAYKDKVQSLQKWHARLGHMNMDSVKCALNRLDIAHTGVADDQCSACTAGKMRRQPYPSSNFPSDPNPTAICDILHSDVCSLTTTSSSGFKYFVTFVDEFSGRVFLYFLKNKSDVFSKYQSLVTLLQTQEQKNVKCLQSDNGREYISEEFCRFRDSKGTTWKTSCPRNPQQNGLAERMNQSLLNIARCMLQQSGLPLIMCAEAVNYAVYIYNRMPRMLPSENPFAKQSPLEIWSGIPSDIVHCRTFGCAAWAHNALITRKKFDARSFKCVFLGCVDGTKGYRLLNLESGKVIVERNAVFDEKSFPLKQEYDISCDDQSLPHLVKRTTQVEPDPSPMSDYIPLNMTAGSFVEDAVHNDDAIGDPSDDAIGDPSDDVGDDANDDADDDADDDANDDANDDTNDDTNDDASDDGNCHVSDDVVVRNANVDVPSTLSSRVRKPTNFFKPSNFKRSGKHTDTEFANVSRAQYTEPRNEREAMSCDEREEWHRAMVLEIMSIRARKTYRLVRLPNGARVIRCKWVYKRKEDDKGNVRYKARLVACGCQQVKYENYDETFCAVSRPETFRFLCAWATQNDWEMLHMDVDTAFLYSDIHDTVFMKQPPMFMEPGQEDLVCALDHGLYGLKQSNREWSVKLESTVAEFGFRPASSDPCLYIRNVDGPMVLMLVYVDDIILFGKCKEQLLPVKAFLQSKFKMKDLGALSWYLGMSVERDMAAGITVLHQRKFTEDILAKYGFQDCKPQSTPSNGTVLTGDFHYVDDAHREVERQNVAALAKELPYRHVVGSLQYLVHNTRPDIAFAVGQVSKFCEQPNSTHYVALKRILRYLKGTCDSGLVYKRGEDPHVIGYSDADYAGDLETRRSRSGYAFFLGESLFSWKSKLQENVCKSSTEAEYVALNHCADEGLWIRKLVADIGETHQLMPGSSSNKGLVQILEDNQGAIKLSKNPINHSRIKWLDVKYHFIRQLVNSNEASVQYCPSAENKADIFTKGLGASLHKKHALSFGMTSSSSGIIRKHTVERTHFMQALLDVD